MKKFRIALAELTKTAKIKDFADFTKKKIFFPFHFKCMRNLSQFRFY